MATTDDFQDAYFKSYGDLSVHQIMLRDQPRVLAYRRFFEENAHHIKGKTVMDVGAGTGILSLFAAGAGAKKVFAVEASSIATLCAEIVAENKLSHIIEVIHGAVETISLPEGFESVDIIVSEWMGFYLLHESMLDSVIVARDRFLAPDGLMVPSHASILVAPVDMTEHFADRSFIWGNIYGYDFSPLASRINEEEVSKPLITSLEPKVLCSHPQKLISLDLKTVTAENTARISRLLTFSVEQDSKIFGFAVWFDVEFNVDSIYVNSDSTSTNGLKVDDKGDAHLVDNICGAKHLVDNSNGSQRCVESIEKTRKNLASVKLQTGPADDVTHWQQTVLFLPGTILVSGGLTLHCRMKLAQDSTNKRHYNISVTLLDENDSGDEDDHEQDSDVCDSDDSTDHPVPCVCGSNRCRLIAALVDKYDVEHRELGEEAKIVEVEAEMDAAKQLEEDIENGGWQVDSTASGVSGNGSINDSVEIG